MPAPPPDPKLRPVPDPGPPDTARGTTAGRIYDVAMQHRRELLASDVGAARRMTQAYTYSWQRLRMQIDRFLQDYSRAKAAGDIKDGEELEWARRFDRLVGLQHQIEQELRGFASIVGHEVTAQQGHAVFRSGVDVSDIMAALQPQAALPEPSVSAGFGTLPTEAYTQLVGHLGNGSPLTELLDTIPGGSAASIGQRLTAGIALGLNARTIARQVAQVSGVPLDRALTISRTETMRAYRESTGIRYEENADVLDGWTWLAGLGPRCCAACVAKHGSFHQLGERMHSHPNCRCIQAPHLRETEKEPFETGDDWFARQDAETQEHIIGQRAAFEAYKRGDVALGDFVGVRHSRDWGSMVYQRSLTEMVGAQEALKIRRSVRAASGGTIGAMRPPGSATPSAEVMESIENHGKWG